MQGGRRQGDRGLPGRLPEPPSPPAGPIPVPYPDTSFSKDMQNGSKTVLIEGKEVMLKDQSFYKTSPLGDEAATNGHGAGVITPRHHGQDVFRGLVDGREVRGPERRPAHRRDDLQPRQPDRQCGRSHDAASGAPGEPKVGHRCCNKKHEGQQGAVTVSEEHRYGLDEKPEIDKAFRDKLNHPPARRTDPNPHAQRRCRQGVEGEDRSGKRELQELAEREQAWAPAGKT